MSQTVLELFAAAARAQPDAPALIQADRCWDYTTLARYADRLAAHLRHGLGLPAESLVAVAGDRTPEMVGAVLGVLAAGCAYLPFDPAEPGDRLAALFTEAKVQAVIGLSGPNPAGVPGVVPGELSAAPSGSPPAPPHPRGLAYVIYTSGSTGRPKGVAVEHGALAGLVAWSRDFFLAGPGDVFLQFARLTFDVSVWEIFTPLCTGGALVRTHAVTHVDLPGFVLDAMRLDGLGSLRFCGLGADVVAARTVRHAAAPGRVVFNSYGPTEATEATVAAVCDPGSSASPPIGSPVAGTTACVVDDQLGLVAAGETGELYLGGRQLARGYLGRPDLTADRFVPDPFGAEPGARVYRTGDLVRQRGDGTLEFVGRRDRQVKIRGIRVEPAELELALRACAGVREAVVTTGAHRDRRRLVGHVTGDVDPVAIQRRLTESVPGHLLPATVIVHPELPRTANGKPDLARLERLVPHRDEHPPADLPLLARLAWEAVGETPRPDDSLLDLGGDSLDAMRLVARLRGHGLVLDVRELLSATPLALLRPKPLAAPDEPAAVGPVPAATEPSPLTPTQAAMWFHQRLRPASTAYHFPVHLELTGPLDLARLTEAWRQVVGRHDALRTRIVVRGVRASLVTDADPPPLVVHDLSRLAPAAQQAEQDRVLAERPFRLAESPAFRADLLRFSATRHLLAITVHHVMCDGWSSTILLESLADAYRSAPGSATPAPSFQQYARQHWREIEAGRFDDGVAYWRALLDGRDTGLDTWSAKRATAVAIGEVVDVPPGLTDRLRRRCREAGVTLAAGLLAGYAHALATWLDRADLVIGMVFANRPDIAATGLVGQFVNTLPLPVDVASAAPLPELAREVQRVVRESLPHWEVPLPLISAALGGNRARRAGGPWHALFELDNTPPVRFEAGELSGHLRQAGLELGAVSEVSLRVVERRTGLRAILVGDAGAVDAADLATLQDGVTAAWHRLAGTEGARG
jgi:amino acid adenylation domain-containing protein